MPRTAAVERFGIVNGAEISVGERHVEWLVAVLLSRRPSVSRRLGHPNAVGPKRPRRVGLPPFDEAFARLRVVGKFARGRRREPVGGLEMESHQRSRSLPGNARAVNAVARHRIRRDAVIEQSDGGERSTRIDAVFQLKVGQPVRIVGPGGHDDGLAGGGKHRSVADVPNSGSGIGDVTAVASTWCARVDGRGEPARSFEVIAFEPE